MSTEFFEKLSQSHPFITVCSYAGSEYIGVIQNRDDIITTFYDYGSIIDPNLKKTFLTLGDEWWWSSNRMIPINIFLKHDWLPFKQYLRAFNNKGLIILHGPATSMSDIAKKRAKRRSITLVRKMP